MSSPRVLQYRLLASRSLVLAGLGAIAAVELTKRFAPALVHLVRGAAAVVLIVVVVALFRGFRPRGDDDRRQDERREDERRNSS